MPEMRKELLSLRDDLFVIHDFLSPVECEHYIALSESKGFEDAPINTLGGTMIRKDVRNNDRVILDDFSLAAMMWERLRPLMPPSLSSFVPSSLNERWRFYRYEPGQQFDWHFDGCFERTPTEQSRFTLMIYLNGYVAGGATEFNMRSYGGVKDDDPTIRVQPEAGKALLFPHNILHRGASVADGIKYVMRTVVMCRWTER